MNEPMKTNLPRKVYFIMNPEGKIFDDSVRHEKHICKIDFVKSWLCTWPGMQLNMIEADNIFRIFERGGFRIIEIELPKLIDSL